MQGLHLSNIHKSFGATRVLEDVSFSADPGCFVVIVGPSGCGKTTMLRALAGLEAVDAGEIALAGRDITDLSPAARNIAMVFQNYALYPTKTVRQNIGFGLRQRKTARADIDRRVAEVANTLQMAHLLDRRPSQLSGGQRQRVAIGRAMVRDPALFLFDEPLSNLDAALRNDLRIEIKRIHRQMETISVFVTHDQLEAMSLADILVVMRDGRIEQMGPPYDVFRNPATRFVAGFIGTPAMNFLPARVDQAGAVLSTGLRIQLPALQGLAAGTLIDIGIRPEDLALCDKGADDGILGRVDVIQELGTTRLISFLTDCGPISMVQPAAELRPEREIGLRLISDNCKAFLHETGEVIK